MTSNLMPAIKAAKHHLAAFFVSQCVTFTLSSDYQKCVNFKNSQSAENRKVFQKYFYLLDFQDIEIFNSLKSYPKRKFFCTFGNTYYLCSRITNPHKNKDRKNDNNS